MIAAASGWNDARVAMVPGRLRIELDDDAFAYGASAVLEFVEPSYVELPMKLEARFVQLATAPVRSYLASRTELGAEDVAVAIVDDENRFCFVVASRVSFWRLGRSG